MCRNGDASGRAKHFHASATIVVDRRLNGWGCASNRAARASAIGLDHCKVRRHARGAYDVRSIGNATLELLLAGKLSEINARVRHSDAVRGLGVTDGR